MKKRNPEKYKVAILKALVQVSKDEHIFEHFIKDILTPKELDNLGTRWQVVQRLAKGEKHRDIADALDLGVATVTRGSREMRKEEGGIRKALRHLKIAKK